MQRSPEQLLAFLPSGKALALPNTADQCKGIIWLPNNELDTVSWKMIDIREAVRHLSTTNDSDCEESYDGNIPSAENSDSLCDTTGQRKLQKKLDIEYMRLAKRVRMDALKNSKVHAVEIWGIAVRMMVVSRVLLLEDRSRIIETCPEGSPSEDGSAIEQEEHDPADFFPGEQKPADFPSTEHTTSSFDPPFDAYDVEFPALQVPTRNGKVDVHNEVEVNNTTPEDSTPEPPMPAVRQTRVRVTARSSPSATHQQSWRAGLPLELWRRIIADAVSAEGILSQNQQEQIMRYASDWDVLAYKLTIQGAEDYQQIWKFLETVSCFTYSPKS